MTESLQPWEQRFCGFRWNQMPGGDPVTRKLNFALWRRGLVKIDQLKAEARESEEKQKPVKLVGFQRNPLNEPCDPRQLCIVVKALKVEIKISGMSEKRALKRFNLSEGSLTPRELLRVKQGRYQRFCEMLTELQQENKQKDAA